MSFAIEYRIPADEIREGYFIERTLTEAKNAKHVLMLLGDMHVDAVEERLRKLGHIVEATHELIPVKRWRESFDV